MSQNFGLLVKKKRKKGRKNVKKLRNVQQPPKITNKLLIKKRREIEQKIENEEMSRLMRLKSAHFLVLNAKNRILFWS